MLKIVFNNEQDLEHLTDILDLEDIEFQSIVNESYALKVDISNTSWFLETLGIYKLRNVKYLELNGVKCNGFGEPLN